MHSSTEEIDPVRSRRPARTRHRQASKTCVLRHCVVYVFVLVMVHPALLSCPTPAAPRKSGKASDVLQSFSHMHLAQHGFSVDHGNVARFQPAVLRGGQSAPGRGGTTVSSDPDKEGSAVGRASGEDVLRAQPRKRKRKTDASGRRARRETRGAVMKQRKASAPRRPQPPAAGPKPKRRQ
eukprot:1713121-Rhodomonas_salina.2